MPGVHVSFFSFLLAFSVFLTASGFSTSISDYENLSFKKAKLLADKGDAEAQVIVALEYGKGPERNAAQEIRYFKMAAEQGHALAQANLANLYYTGLGVKRDLKVAAQWAREAAEKSMPSAQALLVRMYFKGDGVLKDYVESYKWLKVVNKTWDAEMPDDLLVIKETLEKKMTRDEIAEAEERALVFDKNHHFPPRILK